MADMDRRYSAVFSFILTGSAPRKFRRPVSISGGMSGIPVRDRSLLLRSRTDSASMERETGRLSRSVTLKGSSFHGSPEKEPVPIPSDLTERGESWIVPGYYRPNQSLYRRCFKLVRTGWPL